VHDDRKTGYLKENNYNLLVSFLRRHELFLSTKQLNEAHTRNINQLIIPQFDLFSLLCKSVFLMMCRHRCFCIVCFHVGSSYSFQGTSLKTVEGKCSSWNWLTLFFFSLMRSNSNIVSRLVFLVCFYSVDQLWIVFYFCGRANINLSAAALIVLPVFFCLLHSSIRI
jgi:hypothetical protein